MKKKCRLPLILFSMCLVIILALSALAEGTLSTLYNAGAKLLFDTSNVTLTAHADFTYDGQHFKTFDGKYIQAGFNSLMNVTMTTPTSLGDSSQSGYTVIGNGEQAYEMRMDEPNKYFPLHTQLSSSVLSDREMTILLKDVGSTLINMLEDTVNSAIAIEKIENGTQYTLRYAAGEAPEALNAAISLIGKKTLDEYFSHPYIYQLPLVVIEDRDGLIETLYQETYHMPVPDESDMRDKNGNPTAAYERYSKIRAQVNQLKMDVTATTQHSAVVIHADKSQTTYNTLNDFLVSKGELALHYEDYSPVLSVYSQQHPDSTDPAADMTAYYRNILIENKCAGMLIEGDGDYILCYNDDTLCRLTPYNHRTTAERILAQLEEISLHEADASLTLDDQGRISAAKGQCTLKILDFVGREHLLTITFDCAADDYGQSVVKEFDPKDYGINDAGFGETGGNG